jgi:hypothetical protein
MSSIKLKGSTSGDITISAPAVAGTNTLTLPAQTGTVPISNVEFVTQRKTATPIIINGDMQNWQRGTSITSAGYTADRWEIAGSSMTASRSTDVPNDTFKYSYSFVGSSQSHVKQKIEAQNIYHVKGQDITISFYLKQTVGAGTDKVGVVLYTPTAEDDYSGVTEIASQNITTTSSWARYVVTFTNIASSVTNGLQPLLFFTSTDSQTMLFTGFQLEVGNFDSNSIPDFQFEDASTSLARCQRYFQKLGGSAYTSIGTGILSNARTRARSHVPYNTTMRSSPTLSIDGTLIVTERETFETDISSIDGSVAGVNGAFINFEHSATGTALYPVLITVKNGTTSFLELSSEL